MKAYYAHPISLYNSPQEKRDVALLKLLGFEVLNPNSKECDEGYKAAAAASPTGNGMGFFTGLVGSCQAFVMRGFHDGTLPAGVAKEYKDALDQGKKALEFPTAIARRTIPFGVRSPDQELLEATNNGLGFGFEQVGDIKVEVFETGPSGTISWELEQGIRIRQKNEIPFLEIPVNVSARILSVDATREALKECGCR